MKRKFLSGILILTLIMTYTGTASASPSEDEAASSTSSTSIKEVIIQCLDYIDGQIESALLDSNSDDGDEDADENQSAQSAQADTSKSQSSNLSSSGNNQSSSSSGQSSGSSGSSNQGSGSSGSSGGSASQPKPPQIDQPAPDTSPAGVLAAVNQFRAEAGVAPVSLDSSLNHVAQLKADDMGKNNYFDHTSPTYGSVFDMLGSFGIIYSVAGENISQGPTSAYGVVEFWMTSPGHRANILRSNFTKMGVGYCNVNGITYWAQIFPG